MYACMYIYIYISLSLSLCPKPQLDPDTITLPKAMPHTSRTKCMSLTKNCTFGAVKNPIASPSVSKVFSTISSRSFVSES